MAAWVATSVFAAIAAFVCCAIADSGDMGGITVAPGGGVSPAAAGVMVTLVRAFTLTKAPGFNQNSMIHLPTH
jgi:hypothetical protein